MSRPPNSRTEEQEFLPRVEMVARDQPRTPPGCFLSMQPSDCPPARPLEGDPARHHAPAQHVSRLDTTAHVIFPLLAIETVQEWNPSCKHCIRDVTGRPCIIIAPWAILAECLFEQTAWIVTLCSLSLRRVPLADGGRVCSDICCNAAVISTKPNNHRCCGSCHSVLLIGWVALDSRPGIDHSP